MSGTPLGSLRAAASRLRVPFDVYLERRAAGLRWCSTCRSWQPAELVKSRNTCRACARERMRRLRTNRVEG